MSYRPYFRLMRLHQPTGIWLLLWPSWWAIGLAAQDFSVALFPLLLFLLGAVVMRSAGCIVNDLWDRNIDAHVERTKLRPLAAGDLQVWQALVLLAVLLLAGLLILLNLNLLTITLGFVFLGLLIVYPLMKRVMQVPQIFLGLTINAGTLMGWSTVEGSLAPTAWLLYAACFCWTLSYDTIYAHQDKLYDAQIGVNSAALVLGKATKKHIGCYYTLMLLLLLSVGLLAESSWFYYFALLAFFVLLFRQLVQVDLDDVRDCLARFRAQGLLGGIVFMGIVLDFL